jgi:hypothetical protein
MKGNNLNVNKNQLNKNTENAVNRIQNSLNKLQSTISNNKNAETRNKNNIRNIRKKILDSDKYEIESKDMFLSEMNNNDQIPIGYSMFNNRSVIRTDKRNFKINQSQLNYYYNNNTNISDDIPKLIHVRKTNSKKDKDIFNNNSHSNSVIKWKCLNCGNINLLYNKNCINCGRPKNNQIIKSHIVNIHRAKNNLINYIDTSYEKADNEINNGLSSNNNSNYESSIGKESRHYTHISKYSRIREKIITSKPNSTFNASNNMNRECLFTASETNIINNSNNKNNISELADDPNTNMQQKYKKLNDLYLYGDYLETELKESNDENSELLEQIKKIKIDVHNLNQKNRNIKQKVEELQNKDKELKILNTQLKNGLSLVQKKMDFDFGKKNNENIKLLKELELTNKKNLEKQKKYDKEIENLKQKILKLTNEEEDNENDDNNDGNDIKELINNIEKEKKEMEENNDKYILLLKNNELLNQDIEKLQKKIELNLSNNNTLQETEDPIKKLATLKENVILYDKEINENKIITNDLINEYKNLIKIYEEKIDNNEENNNDNGNDSDENDKNEYLILKEKNSNISEELLKLKEITKYLTENKDKIISIYENEINKLNNFYLKVKEKTMISKKEENDTSEIETQKKLIYMHEEIENIKKENYKLIKDLEEMAKLQVIYQEIMEENKKLKSNIYSEENQNLLKEIINDENIIKEEKNDEK